MYQKFIMCNQLYYNYNNKILAIFCASIHMYSINMKLLLAKLLILFCEQNGCCLS